MNILKISIKLTLKLTILIFSVQTNENQAELLNFQFIKFLFFSKILEKHNFFSFSIKKISKVEEKLRKMKIYSKNFTHFYLWSSQKLAFKFFCHKCGHLIAGVNKWPDLTGLEIDWNTKVEWSTLEDNLIFEADSIVFDFSEVEPALEIEFGFDDFQATLRKQTDRIFSNIYFQQWFAIRIFSC